ncbi:hypothetical protein C2S52_019762 [Perilla frutescens var. hirtella]|nr:hypothetical protein C2S52_019762 [Perilla frutescens var. hirtella]
MDLNRNASHSLIIDLFGEDSHNEYGGGGIEDISSNPLNQNNVWENFADEGSQNEAETNNDEKSQNHEQNPSLSATNNGETHCGPETVGEDDFKYALFVCSKFGKPTSQSASKKVMCKARINAKRVMNGSWVVTKMCSDHNHDLDPSYSILMPSHRSISVQMKRQLEANDRAGLRPCKSIRLLEVQSGGPDNLGCLPKDCRNFIEERRMLRLGEGDAEAVRNLFVRLKAKDPNFYHLMDIDDEGRLRNVLWIHPRSIAAYEEFHDVLSFDTTYLVNRHQMPFAAFVGVNHHGQSILLGCALVTHEDAESFKWIFSNWLEAMGGVYPTGIITDQCDSIRNALMDIMPYSIHSLSIEIFELKWGEFIVKHHLQNNKWLKDLYSEREKWVPVYLNHTFWAGMISTQRSEGRHAYFDEFLHSRCTLMQFMEQYEMAMSSKIQKEFIADFDSKNKIFVCSTEYPWEAQFQRVHIKEVEKGVQRRCSSIFFAGGYPHMTPEYKKFQEVEKFFQDSADLAFGNVEKMDFIKRKCMEIKNRLENWNSTTATNVSDSRTSGRSNVIGTPILNPQVTRTKGRPTEKRFKSCLEKGGRGRGRTTRARGGNSEVLNLLAKMMSRARDRHFMTIDLVIKLKELKDVFYSFENFKRLPGINYDEENNVVTAADAYFSGFNDFNKESPVHQEFRVNGMDEFRAIREIVVIGGVIKLDFEALSRRVDC